jgi:hypothetical protein
MLVICSKMASPSSVIVRLENLFLFLFLFLFGRFCKLCWPWATTELLPCKGRELLPEQFARRAGSHD